MSVFFVNKMWYLHAQHFRASLKETENNGAQMVSRHRLKVTTLPCIRTISI